MGENFKIGNYKIEGKNMYNALNEAGITNEQYLKMLDKNNDKTITENELQTFIEDIDDTNSNTNNTAQTTANTATSGTKTVEEVEEEYWKQIQVLEKQIENLEEQRHLLLSDYSKVEDASEAEQVTSNIQNVNNQISNLRGQVLSLMTNMEMQITRIKQQELAAAQRAANQNAANGTGQVMNLSASNGSTNYGNFSYNFSEKLSSRQQSELQMFKSHWAQNKSRYQSVASQTGVPAELIAAIHWREASGNFNRRLHDGGSLSGYSSWEASAVDALSGGYGNIDLNDINTWYDFAERYNGLGYKNKGLPSPYVWAGTTNYTSGKYVADGVFDPGYVDQQLGVAVMLKAIL